MENRYFEDQSQPRANEDEIIKRIKECEMVVNKLSADEVWGIVLKDAKLWAKELDSKWQDVADEKIMKEMRIMKLAYKHIIDLPYKYKQDLESLQDNLKKENEIQKDYDE